MPETILEATADGSETQWGLGAGTTKWGAVAVDDGDASYISLDHLVSTSAQTFVLENLPAGAVGVRTVSVRHRARRGTTVSPPSAVNGVIKLGSDILGPVIGGAYWNRRPEAYYLDFFTPDIAKLSGSWTPTDINNAQVGVRLASLHPPDDATEEIRVTALDLRASWDAATAPLTTGFAAFVGSIVGAVIGVGLGPEHIPGIARLVFQCSRGKHRILREEFADLLLSFRAPRRVYA